MVDICRGRVITDKKLLGPLPMSEQDNLCCIVIFFCNYKNCELVVIINIEMVCIM